MDILQKHLQIDQSINQSINLCILWDACNELLCLWEFLSVMDAGRRGNKITVTEPTVPSTGLLGLPSRLYPSNKLHMLSNSIDAVFLEYDKIKQVEERLCFQVTFLPNYITDCKFNIPLASCCVFFELHLPFLLYFLLRELPSFSDYLI